MDKAEPADGAVIEMSHVSMSWVQAATVDQKQAASTAAATAQAVKDAKSAHKTVPQASGAQADKVNYAQLPTSDKDVPADTVADVEAGEAGIELTAIATTDAAAEGADTEAVSITAKPTITEGTYDAELNRSVHTLVDLTFKIQKGELVAVVGTVGSGKSSLLNGLLGELLLTQGTVRVHGRIAYCDQRPWILNDTVQGNVTFGLPYDEAKFDAALYAANMEDDIIVLPGGINTQIGKFKCYLHAVCIVHRSFYLGSGESLSKRAAIVRSLFSGH